MKVDILHRNDLSVAAACRTALDTENRTEGGLTESNGYTLSEPVHTVGKSDGSSSLTLACGGGGNSGNKYELPLLLIIGILKEGEVDLCRMIAVLLDILLVYTYAFGNFKNVLGGD